MDENAIKEKQNEICSKTYKIFRSHRNKSYESIETDFIFFWFLYKKIINFLILKNSKFS
jgi:hypothetical protein